MKSNQTQPIGTSMFSVRCWMLNIALALFLFSFGSALADVRYVDASSTNATPPYTNWTTAATNIQDAVDAAVAGDEVVVTNGTYATGGRWDAYDYGSRVVVDKPLNIRSVNGAQFTFIFGVASINCAYLTNGASLTGFTLANGFSGVGCESNSVVSDCVITRNFGGGGAYGGTLNNCTLTDNSFTASTDDGGYYYFGEIIEAYGGGAAYCTLNNCTLSGNRARAYDHIYYYRQTKAYAYGGGAFDCTLNNCTLSGNSAFAEDLVYAYAYGGGADHCTLNNCVLTDNSVGADNSHFPNPGVRGGDLRAYGGGASDSPQYGLPHCRLNNCTLSGNSAAATNIIGAASSGSGGTYGCTLNNCILFANTNLSGCEDCDSPWFGQPLFVDVAHGNLRLQSNSPCINAGNNSYVTNATDLDGNPRIAGGTVDIGAYEFQSPVSMISYAWLQQFNLPINSSTDTADPDGDGVDNYHEWLAGTNPTNSLSSPAQLTITPSGTNVIVAWSTNAVGFILQSTTNLVSPSDWSTNSPRPAVIGGQNVIINPISGPQQFYRLKQ